MNQTVDLFSPRVDVLGDTEESELINQPHHVIT